MLLGKLEYYPLNRTPDSERCLMALGYVDPLLYDYWHSRLDEQKGKNSQAVGKLITVCMCKTRCSSDPQAVSLKKVRCHEISSPQSRCSCIRRGITDYYYRGGRFNFGHVEKMVHEQSRIEYRILAFAFGIYSTILERVDMLLTMHGRFKKKKKKKVARQCSIPVMIYWS